MTSTDSGPEATVYNTFPLNDCPAELWDRLEAKAIAEQNGAVAALLNGSRHWLMTSIALAARRACAKWCQGTARRGADTHARAD